jgi:hypothetical protein
MRSRFGSGLFVVVALAVVALPGRAHAAMTYSAENATGVTGSSVGSLHAHISSTSSLTYTATFDIGPTTSYGTSVAGTSGANNVPPFFNGTINSVAVNGLQCGTTYHWRLNVAAASTGNDQTLTTSPCLSLNPTSKAFGAVAVNASSVQTFTISNQSAGSLTVSSLAITGADAAHFSVSTLSCPSLTPTLAAGASCSVNVSFEPSSTGAKSASFVVTSNAPDSPTSAALTGTGGGAAVPTVSQWGMILLALGFAAALWVASRRRAA